MEVLRSVSETGFRAAMGCAPQMVASPASPVLVFDAGERHPFTSAAGTGPAFAYTRGAPGGLIVVRRVRSRRRR